MRHSHDDDDDDDHSNPLDFYDLSPVDSVITVYILYINCIHDTRINYIMVNDNKNCDNPLL